jgi:hypothetical protein
MKTAGVVLDFYDDLSGAYLRKLFPSPDDLPECIKTAHILTPEERDVLRDEAYALTMSQNGKVLRKFACVDEGNTVLSVLYFLANKDKLPEEAVKTAAANLSSFCEEFGLPIPETVKLAARSGMARTRDPIKQPILGDSADWAQRTNLVSVRGGADQGRVIPTASQMKTAEEKKEKMVQPGRIEGWAGVNRALRYSDRGIGRLFAKPEVLEDRLRKAVPYSLLGAITGSAVGATVGAVAKSVANSGPGPLKAALHAALPSAMMGSIIGMHKADVEYLKDKGIELTPLGFGAPRFTPEAAKKYLTKKSNVSGTGASNLGGGEVLTDDKRHIGVKSKMPKLNENDRINLDSFHRLNPSAKPKTTMVDVTGKEPKPKVKRSSANLTALGGRYPLDSMADVQKAIQYFEENRKEMEPIEVHIFAVKTAARAEELGLPVPEDMSRYGSIEFAPDVDFHMANRLAVCAPEYKELYTTLREKRAHMEPEEFAELLTQADTMSNLRWHWGGDIADPYYATFGKTASSWSWQSRTGDFVSEDDLKWLVRNGRPLIHKHFSSDLVNAFLKDPIAIFESLPDDSKVIIARLAADRFDGLGTN